MRFTNKQKLYGCIMVAAVIISMALLKPQAAPAKTENYKCGSCKA